MISQHLSYTTHFPDLTHEHVMLTLIESTHLIQMPLIIALFHKKLQHPLIQSGYGTGKYIIDPSVGLQKALRQHQITDTDGRRNGFGKGSDINDLSALMEDDYGIIPFPKGDGQKDYTCILMNNRFYGLASNNSQVEDAGKVLVALGNRTFTKAANWDGEHASYVRDKESLEMLRKIRSYSSVFRVTTTSFEKYAADACVDQKMTPKQAMESIINSAQAEINERFGV